MSDLASGLASTTNSAPAAPASAPAASPAPSTPSPAPTASESLHTALQAAYSEPEQPEQQPPTPVQEAQAGEVPTKEEPPKEQEPGAAENKGPIPFEVHQTALKNARTKEREAVTQEYASHLQFVEAWSTDPLGMLQRTVEAMRSDPTLGPQLASMAGKQLAAQRTARQQTPRVEQEPQPDVFLGKDERGQDVWTYSPQQLKALRQWEKAQIRQELTQELKPALDIAKEREAKETQKQYVEYAMQGYRPYVEVLTAMPGFKDYQAEIIARQNELLKQSFEAGQPVDPMALAFKAYNEIVPAKLQAKQHEQLNATALAKAAGRDPNPAAVTSSPPPAPKSMLEALQQVGLR